MTVRWKPLLILSGLFFVVAVLGVIAMAWTLVPRSAEGVLKQARDAAAAGRFEDAEIYYKQALQFEAKKRRDPRGVRQPLSRLGQDRAGRPPGDARRPSGSTICVKAVKFDKNAKGPKIQLLEARHGPGQRRRVGLLGAGSAQGRSR